MRLARPLVAAAVAAAAFALPQAAEAACVYQQPIGGACVEVRPRDPNDPVDVRCGGTFWTCAPII